MASLTTTRLPDPTIIGPFSHWPRRSLPRRRIALIAGGSVGVGVFLHCIAPMLMMA